MGKVKDPRIAAIVARNIRSIREAKPMTQKQLADKVGWAHQSMLNQIEKGHRGMGPQTLRKLADALEVDPGVFYLERLHDDLKLAELMGVSGIPPERPRVDGGSSTFGVLTVYNMSQIHRELLSEDHSVGILPVLKNYPSRKGHDLIGVEVDNDNMAPTYARCDILCVDLDDRPSIGEVTGHGEYICRITDENAVYKVAFSGCDVSLEKITQQDEEFAPFRFDLRCGLPIILGKVLWAVKFYT